MHRISELPLAPRDQETVADVLKALCGKWPIERVVLFGSKARGDDVPDSDIDLLFITTEEMDRSAEDAMQEEAWQAGMRRGCCVQLVVRSHERWYHGIDQATPLRLQIDADGVEVFPDDR